LRDVLELREEGILNAPHYIKAQHPEAVREDGTLKQYIPAREYLRKIHPHNLGSPIYKNEAKNLFMIGARGYGKSFCVGVGIVAHEFLFDGKTSYNLNDPITAAEIVVGAGDAKYSSETLGKTKVALDNLPGGMEINGVYYPCPFYKQYKGSWTPARQIEHLYKKKIGGSWTYGGTGSNIKHRTFKDNPFAANGTRPGVMIFEEVGMFENLRESYNASVECQRYGSVKFGSMMFLGTGGDMEGGGTLDAQELFYNPDNFDCITFPDIWENRGKIGYFVPAYKGLDKFKPMKKYSDGKFWTMYQDGETDYDAAKTFLNKHRDKLRQSKGSMSALEGEIINRPQVPSEVFLQKHGNIFPVTELRDRLVKLEESGRWKMLEKNVSLYLDPKSKEYNGVNYKIDVKNRLNPINKYPWKESEREGCVTIYEFPKLIDDRVPEGAYIIGHDPYANDDPSGESLAAVYVLKTKKHFSKLGHDEIVATYVARPYAGRHVVNETILKLSLMYGNAKIYFENVRGNVKEYFEKIKKLHLLAKQPTTVLSKKASYMHGSAVVYGYPMSSRAMKMEAIQYVRDWLLEEREVDGDRIVYNLDRIWDRALLQELIAFNMDGNFDRVMALAGCIVGLNETHNQYEKELVSESKVDQVVSFLVDNSYIFNNTTRP